MTEPLTAAAAILRRRETLRFDPDRPVPDELLRRALHLATRSASSFNLQPWRFLVVRSPGGREEIRRCAYGSTRVAEAPVSIVVLGYHHPQRTHLDAIADAMKTRAGLPSEAINEYRARSQRHVASEADPASWAARSCMMAVATLMVAAEDLGLATSLIDEYDPDRLRRTFGVPADHGVVALVTLGYTDGESPDVGRLGLGEVCYQEHFGQPWTLGEAD